VLWKMLFKRCSSKQNFGKRLQRIARSFHKKELDNGFGFYEKTRLTNPKIGLQVSH